MSDRESYNKGYRHGYGIGFSIRQDEARIAELQEIRALAHYRGQRYKPQDVLTEIANYVDRRTSELTGGELYDDVLECHHCRYDFWGHESADECQCRCHVEDKKDADPVRTNYTEGIKEMLREWARTKEYRLPVMVANIEDFINRASQEAYHMGWVAAVNAADTPEDTE